MPSELLSEIISWTLPLMVTDSLSALPTDSSPWILTHISRRWRTVAISNPSLVAISYPDNHRSLPMIEAQLARAQKLQIHFYGSESSDFRRQVETFGCLAKHASQWDELSIGLSSHLLPLLAGLRDDLPMLRRVWVEWDSASSQDGVYALDCFETARSLVDISLYNEFDFVSFFCRRTSLLTINWTPRGMCIERY
ncbi:hypothetical protein C8F04DRAFT_746582 [Mycena alexandri]|uniref:F-box domain-containing protein n=1 Tax=Mycena alexandri TaxID=1745969 RepID=A0AAD6X2D8_9AGAR|nr:hypothetical protein C8F04DRAFT_746582 [Mycena alexandri]